MAVTATRTPLAGRSHLVAARVQGTSRFYAAGLEGDEAVILREDHGTTILARIPFAREHGRDYRFALTATGDALSLSIDGKDVLAATDATFRYGMAGLRMGSAGRMTIARFEVEDVA